MFFSYNGWLEFGIFAKFYRAVNSDEKIDDTKNVGSSNEEARQRAEQEENRRREESMFMRTSYAHFSGRMSTFGGSGSSSRRGNSMSGIQTMYPAQSLHARNTVQQQALLRASLVAQDAIQSKDGQSTGKLSVSSSGKDE